MFQFTCKRFLDPFTDYWIRKLEKDKHNLELSHAKLERRVFILEIRNSFLKDIIHLPHTIEEEPPDIHPDSLWQPWAFEDHNPDSGIGWVSELFALTHT